MTKIKTTTKKTTKTTTAKTAAPVKVTPKVEVIQVPARKGGVAFELVEPAAHTVQVAGSFNNWAPQSAPLSSDGKGRWVTNLDLKPGRHEYLFVVDGTWLPDPKAPERVQNPFGGHNSVLIVAE